METAKIGSLSLKDIGCFNLKIRVKTIELSDRPNMQLNITYRVNIFLSLFDLLVH